MYRRLFNFGNGQSRFDPALSDLFQADGIKAGFNVGQVG